MFHASSSQKESVRVKNLASSYFRLDDNFHSKQIAMAELTVSIKAELDPVEVQILPIVLAFFSFTITADASDLFFRKCLFPAKTTV